MNRSAIVASALLAGALLGIPAASVSAQAPTPSAGAHSMARRQPSFPAQPAVALKAKFATVPAGSSAVKAAIPANDLAGAGKLIGKRGSLQGTVAQLYSPRDHDIAILDFAKDYKSAVTAIVKPANYSKLPSLQSLVGKHVLVTGTFTAYQGRPQIEVTSPSQVKIVR